MIYILLLFIALLLICEIFSIILKVTGLDIKKARFQIISILTHTGFTTRESELIAQHPIRRKIISFLMLISYVLELVFFSLLITSIRKNFTFSFLIICGVFLFIIIFFKSYKSFNKLENKLASFLSKRLMKKLSNRYIVNALYINDEYEAIEFIVGKEDYICNKYLKELNIDSIIVLLIDKGEHLIPTPKGKDFIEEGDRVVIYGDIAHLKTLRNNQIN